MTTYSETALIKVTFSGINGAGYVSVPGLKVGDVVLAAHNGALSLNTNWFFSLVDTVDTIYQADSSDNTAKTFTVILARTP